MRKRCFWQFGQTLIPKITVFPREYHIQDLTEFGSSGAAHQRQRQVTTTARHFIHSSISLMHVPPHTTICYFFLCEITFKTVIKGCVCLEECKLLLCFRACLACQVTLKPHLATRIKSSSGK